VDRGLRLSEGHRSSRRRFLNQLGEFVPQDSATTCRYLLSNLYDFVFPGATGSRINTWRELDLLALGVLRGSAITRWFEAYRRYEFHDVVRPG